ncbi:MAG: hypothetical protein GY856_36575, partial [bacterium]|nr:hypothetical protein [bacterium]
MQPSEVTYLGAFRLPEVHTGLPAIWDWGGQAMTYYPEGDPGGGGDGFPGSLYATGLDTANYVSEFSIPTPSTSRNLSALPVAITLQELADVREGLFAGFDEMPLASMQYLPAQGGQSSEQLYLAWGQHLHSASAGPTHAWCDLDLEHPNTQGAWWIGDADAAAAGFIYSVDAYLLAIPDAWADAHAGGMKLATGRFRDGGWSGTGPSLIACGPWLDGTPPPPGAELSYRTLLLYSHTRGGAPPVSQRLDGYSDSDVWNGGAWITAGTKSAVVFAGTKGSGYTWYGFYTPASVAAPPLFGEGAPCPHTAGEIMCYQPDGVTPCTPQELGLCTGAAVVEASRGWWASRFDAQLLFYDPDDLAAVAAGTMEPHEPQPYATLDLDEHLLLNATMADVTMYIGHGDQRNSRLGEPAYDRANGRVYLLELFADEYRPVVHVFEVEAGATPATYRLTVSKLGTGSGTVTSVPSGIRCGGDCTHDYAAGTGVTLTAT